MKLGLSKGQIVAYDEYHALWRRVNDPKSRDLIDLLAAGSDALAPLLGEEATRPVGLPFAPGSLRAYALWEPHMVMAAKGMVNRFGSPSLRLLAAAYEVATGKVLPPLRPRRNYHRWPQYYMGNARTLIGDGEELPWPSFSKVVDFELEIGVVIAKKVRNCSPSEGRAAIGGFCAINDWSARDTQWDDTRHGTFGGVVKAKTFAGSMSSVVATADEIADRFDTLSGRVRVNGSTWCEGTTSRPSFGLGEMVAYASMGETVYPGDLLTTGTFPGCCGLEIGRFPCPGDEVQVEVDGIGTITNRLGR